MWMSLIVSIGGMLLTLCASLVGRVLLALGFSYITYSGFDFAITALLTQIQTNMGGMGADVLNLMGFLWVDKAIGLMFSAYAAALVIKMGGSATLTRLIRK